MSKEKLSRFTVKLKTLKKALRLIATEQNVMTAPELADLWCKEHADRNVLLKCDRAVVEVFADVVLKNGKEFQSMN